MNLSECKRTLKAGKNVACLYGKKIVRIELDIPNNSGYGYLSCSLNHYYLADGSYYAISLPFVTSKACCVPYVRYMSSDNKLIKVLGNT